MFTYLFLVWLLWWLRGRVRDRVREVVGETVRGGGRVDVRAVSSSLHTVVSAYGRVAWFGEVAYLRSQARLAGGEPGYTPSFPGISPHLVDEIVRDELRVVDGRVSAPLDEVVERLSSKLGTLVAQSARDVVVQSVSASPETVAGSEVYGLVHGHPVARFLGEVAEGDSDWVVVLRSDGKSWPVVEELVDGYEDEFTEDGWEEAVAELEERRRAGREELDREVQLAKYREHAYWRAKYLQEDEDAAKAQAEIAAMDREVWDDLRDEALEEVRRAEIVLGLRKDTGKRYPVGWARVPTGPFTCPFCLMLCSRGPVYRKNTVTAPSKDRIASNIATRGVQAVNKSGKPIYHWGCDCVGVPVYSGEAYDGRSQVRGAQHLWEYYTTHYGNYGLEAFRDWLATDEGTAKAKELIGDILDMSDKERARLRIPDAERKRAEKN